jgi:hypothetical protein
LIVLSDFELCDNNSAAVLGAFCSSSADSVTAIVFRESAPQILDGQSVETVLVRPGVQTAEDVASAIVSAAYRALGLSVPPVRRVERRSLVPFRREGNEPLVDASGRSGETANLASSKAPAPKPGIETSGSSSPANVLPFKGRGRE